MKILDPKTGEYKEAKIASGTLYTKDCIDCGAHVGGCIVGGESPYKEPPSYDDPCPFCETGRVVIKPAH